MLAEMSISEATAETTPTEYSKIPYIIELDEYSATVPEAEAKSPAEKSWADCDGTEDDRDASDDATIVDTD